MPSVYHLGSLTPPTVYHLGFGSLRVRHSSYTRRRVVGEHRKTPAPLSRGSENPPSPPLCLGGSYSATKLLSNFSLIKEMSRLTRQRFSDSPPSFEGECPKGEGVLTEGGDTTYKPKTPSEGVFFDY